MMVPACDCLNDCGDDPDIYKDKVQPCANFVKRKKVEDEKNAMLTAYGVESVWPLAYAQAAHIKRLQDQIADWSAI